MQYSQVHKVGIASLAGQFDNLQVNLASHTARLVKTNNRFAPWVEQRTEIGFRTKPSLYFLRTKSATVIEQTVRSGNDERSACFGSDIVQKGE